MFCSILVRYVAAALLNSFTTTDAQGALGLQGEHPRGLQLEVAAAYSWTDLLLRREKCDVPLDVKHSNSVFLRRSKTVFFTVF